MTYDGIVSRYLNRPLSRPLARALAHTPATPNALTACTLLLAVAAAGMVSAGWAIAGGIAIQAVSIADGIDGELARIKAMATRFGAAFDAISDRYADALMLSAMAVYAIRFESHPHPELAGALALGGSLIVSYSRARIEASLGDRAGGRMDALFGFASRDVRSLAMAVGTVLGQCYWTLWAIAAATALTIAWRLVYLKWKG